MFIAEELEPLASHSIFMSRMEKMRLRESRN